MKKDIKDKWIAALRSGEYDQTKGVLRREDDEGRASYCCLGVLCELARLDGVPLAWTEEHAIVQGLTAEQAEEWGLDSDFLIKASLPGDATFYPYEDEDLPHIVREWAGLDSANPKISDNNLASYNDGWSNGRLSISPHDFREIADLIEEHVPADEVTS